MKRIVWCLVVLGVLEILSNFEEVNAGDAKTLPHGRFRLQLISGFSKVDDEFNSQGSSVSIGSNYSTTINTNFLSLMQPEAAKAIQQLKAALPALGENLDIASLGLDLSSNVLTNVMTLEYGITDRLSVGLIVPVVHAEVKVKASSDSTSQFDSLVNKAPAPMKAALAALQEQTSVSNINRLMTSELGYSSGLQSWNGTGLGDIELGLKYNYFKSHPIRMTLKTGVRLPTGRTDDPDNLFDVAFGDGQYDLGAYNYIDYDILSNLYLTMEAGYVAQLSHHSDFRVPLAEGVSVSPLRARLNENPGDYVETGLEANYTLQKVFKMAAKYRYYHKFKDNYSSSAGYDTSLLEENTNETLHQAQLHLGYSNLARVKAGKDFFPYEIFGFYYHPIAGENMNKAYTGGVELKSYF